MASRIHTILPQLALGMFLQGLVAVAAFYFWWNKPYEVPGEDDIFAAVEGKWAWTTSDSGCTKEWHRITFTPDRRVMTIAASKPYEKTDGTMDSLAVYDIEAHTRNSIRGAIRGETRLTDAGKPVVWDLVLQSPDRYVWHRTDWPKIARTRTIERCP